MGKIHEQHEKTREENDPNKSRFYSNRINDSMLEEMSEKDFRLYMIKMISKAKDEIREQMQAMNDNTNKLKEHLQEAKDHFNKEIFSKKTKQKSLK